VKTALFWTVTQRVVVIPYRRFGTTYRSHLQWSIFLVFFIHLFIHSVMCLTTGPKRPPKRFLHIVRSRASSFKWEYPLLSLRSSSSFLRLLPHLLATSISPFIFPLITCFIIIIIIIITTTTTTTTAIELSLGGSSPYTSTDKTNKNKYT